MDSELYNQILDEHKELASLPQTLSEVLRVVRDENASTTELANVLQRDPALVTKILRAVNSPYYSSTKQITTVSQAVIRLGLRAVSALALSTSVYHITGNWKSSIDRIRFWRHSLEVAIACREIAESVKHKCPEEAFITGLIHDIGMLVLEKSFPEKFARLWQQASAGENIFDLEDRTWGTNHARIGRFLMEQWNLPDIICEAVGHYHNEFSPGTTDPEFCLPQIVSLGNMISKFSIAQTEPKLSYETEQKKIICSNINLDPDELNEIEKNLFSKTVQEAEFLEMEIGSTDDLMTEANRLLYQQYLTVENLLEENNGLQEEIAREKLKKAAVEALKTISATFNHYVNNAAATILGRAQLVEVALQRGEISDDKGNIAMSMQVIVNGVNTITAVMEELKKLSSFDTIVYHDDTYIIDIENKIKKQLEAIEQVEIPVSTPRA